VRLVCPFVFVLALLPTQARASFLYQFTWGGDYGIESSWSFSSPELLTASTTVPAASLITSYLNQGQITQVQLSLFAGQASIDTTYDNGKSTFFDSGFVGPFDHTGTYTSVLGDSLTITDISQLYVYQFSSGGAEGVEESWSFMTQQLLAATTAIPAADLTTARLAGGQISDVRIGSPLSNPTVRTDAADGSSVEVFYGIPFDHAGKYTELGSTLTITAPTGADAPEPSTLLLAIPLMVIVVWLRKERGGWRAAGNEETGG